MDKKRITLDDMQAWLNDKRKSVYVKPGDLLPSDHAEINIILAIKDELRELQSQYNSMAEKLVNRGYVRPL